MHWRLFLHHTSLKRHCFPPRDRQKTREQLGVVRLERLVPAHARRERHVDAVTDNNAVFAALFVVEQLVRAAYVVRHRLGHRRQRVLNRVRRVVRLGPADVLNAVKMDVARLDARRVSVVEATDLGCDLARYAQVWELVPLDARVAAHCGG